MDQIGNALLNTVMGMGVVFTVLIFISFIISLMKYIPGIIEKFQGKDQEVVAPITTTKQEPEPVVEEEEEELVDDTELVAVITAAIMASMGDEVPADGLVVRSIRRVNRSKWVNA